MSHPASRTASRTASGGARQAASTSANDRASRSGQQAGENGGAAGAPEASALLRDVVAVAVTTAVATSLLLARVLTPLPGTDGAAQLARADFWAGHPWQPLDLRWYAGVSGWGYSLLAPPVVHLLGSTVEGVLCAVVAAAALAVLMVRAGVRRPRFGAAVGGLAVCGNLPTGRSAFALGTALGLLTLVLAGRRAGAGRRTRADPAAGPDRPPGPAALVGVTGLAVATALASPVAALFLGLAAFAWLAGTVRLAGARSRVPLLVGVATGGPLLGIQHFYGDGGRMPFEWRVAWPPIVAGVAVGLLAGRGHRVLRAGACLYVLGVLVTYRLPGSLGSNVERLALLFSAPVLAATAALPGRLNRTRWARSGAALLAGTATLTAMQWQATVPRRDLRDARQELPVAGFAPLRAALPAGLTGRVEVVPLRNHGEAAIMARTSLLARGWDRQVDLAQNALLYSGPLDPAAYRTWLADRAVAYVAIADAPLDWSAAAESALLGHPPDYLEPAAVGGRWRLWRVRDPAPLVSLPATVVRADAAAVVVQAPGPAVVVVRLRWSALLRLADADGSACLEPAVATDGSPGGPWLQVRFRVAGAVRITSGPWPGRDGC